MPRREALNKCHGQAGTRARTHTHMARPAPGREALNKCQGQAGTSAGLAMAGEATVMHGPKKLYKCLVGEAGVCFKLTGMRAELSVTGMRAELSADQNLPQRSNLRIRNTYRVPVLRPSSAGIAYLYCERPALRHLPSACPETLVCGGLGAGTRP